MATPIIMPKQGQSVESCIITKWHKSKGDKVEVGDILFSYETDKASFEQESNVSGTLLEIFFEEGEDVPVLTNVCVIGDPSESYQEFDPRQKKEDIKSDVDAKNEPQIEVEESTVSIEKRIDDTSITKISPRAKNLAEKLNIDYHFATPSGPEGRIIERDINELIKTGPIFTSAAKQSLENEPIEEVLEATGIGGRVTLSDLQSAKKEIVSPKLPSSLPEYQDEPLSNIRKLIAKAMFTSLSTTAQLTLHTSFDASSILEYRRKIKDKKQELGLSNITLNDIILFAVAKTLINHKALNAHFLEDKIRYFTNVHLGVAVDTTRGLMVPTIFDANLKSLNQISKEAKMLAEDCKKATISPDYLKGGTFTVTNLGTFGIESFTPVLNPPQTGILGVNTITYKAKEVNGTITHYPAMGLSLTFDHRALDGADAARFLQELKNKLENFELLLAL